MPSKKQQRKANAKPTTAASDIAALANVATPVPAAPPQPTRTLGGFTLGNVSRTAKTVAANRTFFGNVTERDETYIAFYAVVAAANPERLVTLRALADYAANPNYGGSRKPHDAGAINRASQAGFIVKHADGSAFTLTDTGQQLAANVLGKLGRELPSDAPAEPVPTGTDTSDAVNEPAATVENPTA